METTSEVLTMEEINSRFEQEWVLVNDPQTNEALEVLGGEVLCHGQDRDEVHQRVMELRPQRFAVIYIGEPPEEMEFAL